MHKELICSGSFDGKSWMMEVNKYLEHPKGLPLSVDREGSVILELKQFNPNESCRVIDKYKLNTFNGKELAEIFNYKLETLFNHLQIRDKLYFFTIK